MVFSLRSQCHYESHIGSDGYDVGEELLADTEDEEVSSADVLEFNTTQNKDDKSD